MSELEGKESLDNKGSSKETQDIILPLNSKASDFPSTDPRS